MLAELVKAIHISPTSQMKKRFHFHAICFFTFFFFVFFGSFVIISVIRKLGNFRKI